MIKQLKEEIAEIKGAIQESHWPSPQHRSSRKRGCRVPKYPSNVYKLITDSIQHLEAKLAANTQDKRKEVVFVSLLSPKKEHSY